jgi:hypothetical protein
VRVLLDESVPRPLARLLEGHEVETVGDFGWQGMRNGELLARASSDFDVFVTVDRNLPHQQDLARYAVAVVILEAPTNRMEDLRRVVPSLLETLSGRPASPTIVRAPEA